MSVLPDRPRRLLLASLATALCACPQSPGLAPYPTGFAGSPFAQADLAGDWSYAVIFHGPGVAAGTGRGWERGTLRVSAGGDVTALSAAASDGTSSSTVPTPWTIDGDGFVSAGLSSYVGFNLKLGLARQLAAGTATVGAGGSAFWILLRAGASTTFSGADLAGSSWTYHRLTTGASPAWEHGVATFDANLALSITARVVQSGALADPALGGTAAVDAGGGVTVTGDPTWRGALSEDRGLLVATRTPAGGGARFAMEVYVRQGQVYTLADLAARVSSHTIYAGSGGIWGWSRGVFTANTDGEVTWESSLTNAGDTTLPPAQVEQITSDGTVTIATTPTLHAVELWSKDAAVRTSTWSTGNTYSTFGLNVR